MKKIFKVTEDMLDLKIPIFDVILEYIKNKGFTQTEAGNKLEVPQCEISKFKNRKYEHFSLDRLFRFLNRIGYNVEIHLKGKTVDIYLKKKIRAINFEIVDKNKQKENRS